mgnify:FL=1
MFLRSSHFLAFAASLCFALACSDDRGAASSYAEGQSNHPLVLRLFDACSRGDVELLEKTLARASLTQLHRLFASPDSAHPNHLLKVAGILARVPVPHCTAGNETAAGYRLECQNLGHDLALEVRIEDGVEKLLLPALDSTDWARLR